MQGLRLALITQDILLPEYSDPKSDNCILLNFLRSKQVDASVQVWTDESIDWSQFDVVILKTPWDYVEKIDAFNIWLDKVTQLNVRILNPLDSIRWNANKLYLKDLENLNVAIPTTLWYDTNDTINLAEIFDKLNTEKIIIKPWVSSTAHNTHAITRDQAAKKEDEIKELLKRKALMAQPFLTEVQTIGEYSLLFFNGKYSHAVLKVPKSGDFRVQYDYGGIINGVKPPRHLISAAQYIVDNFAKNCLYTRVDGLNVYGKLTIMELEMIEPNLYLDKDEGSYQRYYEAIETLMC